MGSMAPSFQMGCPENSSENDIHLLYTATIDACVDRFSYSPVTNRRSGSAEPIFGVRRKFIGAIEHILGGGNPSTTLSNLFTVLRFSTIVKS